MRSKYILLAVFAYKYGRVWAWAKTITLLYTYYNIPSRFIVAKFENVKSSKFD